MERDSNDLDATTGTNRDRSTAGNPGGTTNTGGAGSYGAGAGTSNTGSAGIGGTTGLGGSANTGSGSAGYSTGGAGQTNSGSTGATQSAAGAGLGLGGATEGGADQSRTASQGTTDAMRERAGQARERLGEAGAKARDLKTRVEHGLADRLAAGASRLRERGTSTSGSGRMTPAYAGGGATASASTTDDASGTPANVAKGLDATADWLRNGDLKSTIETQARTNPGRTLLVALGVGYLLGKVVRR